MMCVHHNNGYNLELMQMLFHNSVGLQHLFIMLTPKHSCNKPVATPDPQENARIRDSL